MSADARVPNRIDAYAKFWQKDSAADSQTDTDNRLDNYKEVVNGPSLCLFLLFLCWPGADTSVLRSFSGVSLLFPRVRYATGRRPNVL